MTQPDTFSGLHRKKQPAPTPQSGENTEWRKSKNGKKRTDGVTAGVQQLLYDRIKYLCKAHIERGYIATNDLDDLERMHRIYHDDLGGNGFLADLMEKVRKLPVEPVTPDKLADNMDVSK